jgi:sigma-B regulation protein RsbU (phosphoserine phosphatase)
VPSLVKRIGKIVLAVAVAGILLLIFILDVVRRSYEIDIGWILLLRELLIGVAFLILYLLVESVWRREQKPTKKLGFILVITLFVGVASVLLFIIQPSGYDIKNAELIPLGFDSIIWSNVYGVVLGVMMLILLLTIRDIVFSRRKKGTQRNFIIMVGFLVLTAVLTLTRSSLGTSPITSISQGLLLLAMIFNSFRLSWIVYLTKREKIFSIVYGFLLFLLYTGFTIITLREGSIVANSLLYYSKPLQSFVNNVCMLAAIYFGMTFISTLFHLPTAEAFDRKISEVSSLHSLSRLITQVFDFNELADTVTSMTLDVCEAKSSWLEIIRTPPASHQSKRLVAGESVKEEFMTVGVKNITYEEIHSVMATGGSQLRKHVLDSRLPIIIDNIRDDKRTQSIAQIEAKFGSMVIMPLLTHETVIGILYVTKASEYGFDKDDTELISTFADQATIAIENSRLIEKSIERERLLREMMLAQEMQKKLLPQHIPQLSSVEIEALSTPAFEVGGDYFDFKMLDDEHFAVLVGDVSGKGVSAAFYMAEMKGIFQALSKVYREPREFLINAHNALMGTMDKRSFISLIYAVVHLHDGLMKVARAGHCPMLLLSGGKGRFIKPQGLGLGMGNSEVFEKTIIQDEILLKEGDVVVLYTDGITEAYPKNGIEFGYERLLDVIQKAGGKSAEEIRDAIVMSVDDHMNHESPDDDLTLVVMKWKKNLNVNS